MLRSGFSVLGTVPATNGAERAQFQRVIRILSKARNRIGPWCVAVVNHDFVHSAGPLIDGDSDWNGQIDLLLLAEHKIAIYELKGFTARIIYGKTDNSPWVIEKAASNSTEKVRSYFQQASKQRAFLQRDFLPKFDARHPELVGQNHWLVDARVVLKSGSDISGFFFKVPLTETENELEQNVLSRLELAGDREFVRRAFSGVEVETGKLHRIKLPLEDYERLKKIYREHDLRPRTQKWFGIVTEDLIAEDLNQIGSDRFTLTGSTASTMIEELLSLS
jgi:hypothetical protein